MNKNIDKNNQSNEENQKKKEEKGIIQGKLSIRELKWCHNTAMTSSKILQLCLNITFFVYQIVRTLLKVKLQKIESNGTRITNQLLGLKKNFSKMKNCNHDQIDQILKL